MKLKLRNLKKYEESKEENNHHLKDSLIKKFGTLVVNTIGSLNSPMGAKRMKSEATKVKINAYGMANGTTKYI